MHCARPAVTSEVCCSVVVTRALPSRSVEPSNTAHCGSSRLTLDRIARLDLYFFGAEPTPSKVGHLVLSKLLLWETLLPHHPLRILPRRRKSATIPYYQKSWERNCHRRRRRRLLLLRKSQSWHKIRRMLNLWIQKKAKSSKWLSPRPRCTCTCSCRCRWIVVRPKLQHRRKIPTTTQ